MLIYLPLIIALLGLFVAFLLALYIKKKKAYHQEAIKISSFIKQGASAYLWAEYKILALFVIIVAFLLFYFLSLPLAITFVIGAFFSALAGGLGMRIATIANLKTAEAAQKNLMGALRIAFTSGSVMGLTVASLGLLGIAGLYYIFGDPQIIYGFGFGASSVALFARVGGGIYTKAADVGADLAGKVEAGIPEDDPRNPAVIADNVGDNVGDVAGMGADLFESYSDSIIATMVLGTTAIALVGVHAILIPLFLATLGIVVSLIGNLAILLAKKGDPQKLLNRGIYLASILMVIGTYIILQRFSIQPLPMFGAVMAGLVAGIIIGFITEYFTSDHFKPTKNLAHSSKTGAGTNVIAGLGLGMQSTVIPVLVVTTALLISYKLVGIYGIGIAAVGMLSTLGITLAADTYGPVVDNAAGIAEMADMGDETRKRAEQLDAVGNTTAAIGKGFAIGSAALTALVLSISYIQIVGLTVLDLNKPVVVVGLFIGGLMPFIFSALAMKAVGQGAEKIVNEVRRQFKEIKGLMQGTAHADYKGCIKIATHAALQKMVLPGLLTVLVPILVGFLLGKEALGGMLMGAIVTGFLLAVMMANAGGAWDNAKKYIEAGNLGGKGSDAHKAAVVGDTVGDPMKDTSGPSINILIKLMSIIALIIAPLL
ncbi:sodium-translocating pyrophosphatase [Patescibacteria group bacterium AH-259-L05]|nr:sodium-translocating pyrophosphatase [Patescibacteria group bacterium AH-259-L05]